MVVVVVVVVDIDVVDSNGSFALKHDSIGRDEEACQSNAAVQ